jgi:hypothetical protein
VSIKGAFDHYAHPHKKVSGLNVLKIPFREVSPQGMITEPGNMVIYVAGYPAIMGLQPLYFRDSELARRARIPAESAQKGTFLQADLTPAELGSLRANAEELKKGPDQVSPLPCFAVRKRYCS